MMGTKTRSFIPLPHDVSLNDLVPDDHFYRRLEAGVDLSFVREIVAPLYAGGGRPSVDPVVFFKLQLVTHLTHELEIAANPVTLEKLLERLSHTTENVGRSGSSS